MMKKLQNVFDTKITQKNMPNHKRRVIEFISVSDDRGIYNVGGRLGAAKAAESILNMLSNYTLGIRNELADIIFEKNNHATLGDSILQTHQQVRDFTFKSLNNKKFPVVLGGGHDYGYPHLAGAYDLFKQKIAVINVDAHLDVRPIKDDKITSGCPFYLGIENKILNSKNFIEFGIQPHCNDASLFRYLEKNKIKINFLSEIRLSKKTVREQFQNLIKKFSKEKRKIIVSFDVDSVAMAFAPGVSAPQAEGFTAQEFLEMSEICGKSTDVVSVGYFETSPPHDRDQMTVRLVATAIHRMMIAFCSRK